MSLRKSELKNRVIAKKKKLEALIAELKADTQGKTADEIDRLKGMIREAEETLKHGFDDLTESARQKLKAWLEK